MGRSVNTLTSEFAFKLNRVEFVRRIVDPMRYALDLAAVRLAKRTSSLGRNTAIRVALVSDGRVPTSEEQLNPFLSHRAGLRDQLKLVSLRLPLKDVLRDPRRALKSFDVVILKLSFRTSRAEAVDVVRTVREASHAGRVVYLDGDDDLCIQWPEILPYVDLYVKKHLFRDRSRYRELFIGKSNLTDFVHRQYNYSFADDLIAGKTSPVPPEQIFKLKVGCNLATDRNIIKLYGGRDNGNEGTRDNDVVFRGSVPNDWIYYLRKDIAPALRRLETSHKVIYPTHRVATDEYYRELQRSKICVSPFGYGEICWRDFEAILCGCLLVKPDMSHVETNPDIFVPYETYLPVRWDFSDLRDKCSFYLEHEDERKRIVRQAVKVLDSFYSKGIFENFHSLLKDVYQ